MLKFGLKPQHNTHLGIQRIHVPQTIPWPILTPGNKCDENIF